jgi:SAM-dependent methyltransferase
MSGDPAIAALILAALGDARTVLNVGAGAGAYEPTDRDVVAVEPSEAMRAQRPLHLPRAVDAIAEALPFADASFDAAMTTFSAHHWRDLDKGLAEMRRVTRGPVVILTSDPDDVEKFWLTDYAPEPTRRRAARYPAISRIVSALGGRCRVTTVPIPLHCADDFTEAFYGRPEMFLDPAIRRSSGWDQLDADATAAFERKLRDDLESGAWDNRHSTLRTQPCFAGSLRLIVAHP